MIDSKKIIRVLYVIMFFNVVVMLIKIVLGLKLNSSAIFADGLHSLSDSFSNVVGIVAIKFASKPADNAHSYGHTKIETIASLVIAGVLFYTGINIVITAIDKILNPTQINISLLNILVMIITLAINIVVATTEHSYGKRLKSSFLIADAKHTFSDIYVTIGVIITIVVLYFNGPVIIDPLISIVVALIILKTGFSIFLSSSNILIDKAVIDNEEIRAIVMGFDEIKDVYEIRNRGNEVSVFVEFIVLLDKDMTVFDSHNVVESIENKIRDTYDKTFVFNIHSEPF